MSINKELKNDDGTMETLEISSNDNKTLDLKGTYVLANHSSKKRSKFKDSILGSDIGVKSSGFTNVAILASVIAIATILVMYFIWRF